MSSKQVAAPLDIVHVDFDKDIPADLIGPNKKDQLIAYNGDLFMLKNKPTHTILTKSSRKCKIDQPKIVAKYSAEYSYLLDNRIPEYKMPKDLFRYIMKFFRDIYREHKAECGVVLFLNPETKEWRVFFPIQTGNGGHLDYLLPVRRPKNKKQREELNIQEKDLKLYEKAWNDKEWNAIMNKSADEYEDLFNQGFLNYGTIHSHCEMTAFHSGVDDEDEFNRPGIHITIGKVNSDFDYSARLISNKIDWKLDILDLVDVKSTDELKENIDDVVVDKKDLERFIYELDGWGWSNASTVGFHNGYNGGYSSQFQQHGTTNENEYGYYNSYTEYWKDKNSPKATNLLANKSFQNENGDRIELDEDPDIQFEEGEILMERNSFRIYDKKTKLTFWVTMSAYTENKLYFEQDRFKILRDPPVENVY